MSFPISLPSGNSAAVLQIVLPESSGHSQAPGRNTAVATPQEKQQEQSFAEFMAQEESDSSVPKTEPGVMDEDNETAEFVVQIDSSGKARRPAESGEAVSANQKSGTKKDEIPAAPATTAVAPRAANLHQEIESPDRVFTSKTEGQAASNDHSPQKANADPDRKSASKSLDLSGEANLPKARPEKPAVSNNASQGTAIAAEPAGKQGASPSALPKKSLNEGSDQARVSAASNPQDHLKSATLHATSPGFGAVPLTGGTEQTTWAAVARNAHPAPKRTAAPLPASQFLTEKTGQISLSEEDVTKRFFTSGLHAVPTRNEAQIAPSAGQSRVNEIAAQFQGSAESKRAGASLTKETERHVSVSREDMKPARSMADIKHATATSLNADSVPEKPRVSNPTSPTGATAVQTDLIRVSAVDPSGGAALTDVSTSLSRAVEEPSPRIYHFDARTYAARPETMPTEMARRVAAQFSQGVAPGGEQLIELRLTPEELGTVKYRMVVTETGATIVVQADRGDTLDLIRRHLDALQREFLRAGFEDTSFTFEQGASDDDRADGKPNDVFGPSSPQHEEPTMVQQNQTILTMSPHGLDIRL